jgi:hypothetical protein
LYYWHKHHGVWGVVGIRSIMLFHHLVRYTYAVVAGVARGRQTEEGDMRKQVSGACLRAVLSNSVGKA